MAAMFTILFWCALQVSFFLALALPIYLVVRRRNSSAGAVVAASSLAAVVLLSLLAISPWPRWSLDGLRNSLSWTASPADRQPADSSAMSPALPTAAKPESSPSLLAAMWEAMQLKDPTAAAATSAESAPAASRAHWATWITSILLAGVLLGSAHLAISLLAVRRLIARSQLLTDPVLIEELSALRSRLGITHPVTLCVSREIATPATVGTLRPVLLLPPNWQSWSLFERRAVLAHELAHIARRDFAAWLVARTAIVLHFYHPLVRWFVARLQLDQELAADAAAAARLLDDRNAYLHALANLALATPSQRGAGLVRTFIPGRSLLVRRVEMLRTNQRDGLRSTPTSFGRWVIIPLLTALAVVAAGLRAPDSSSLQAAEPAAADKEPAAPRASSGYEFAYIPKDFVFLFAIRPSEIAASPRLKPLAELMNKTMRPQYKFEEMEQMTFVVPLPRQDAHGAIIPGTGSEYTITRMQGDVDFKPLIEATYGTIGTQEYNGKQLLVWGNPPGNGRIEFYSPVAGTLISTPRAQLTPLIDDPKLADPPAAAVEWKAEAKGPLLGVVDMSAMKAMIGGRSLGAFLPMVQPIVDLANEAIITVEDGDPLRVNVSFNCRSAEDAARVEQTLQAIIVILKNIIVVQQSQATSQGPDAGANARPDLLPLLKLANQLLASAKITVNAARVDVTGEITDPQMTIRNAVVGPLWAARQAAARNEALNSLKQLALAALNYEARFGSLPPAVVYGKSAYGDLNPSGDNTMDVPRSWRVELLPFIDQEALYKEYRLDQPWDSEANLAVLRQMPEIFRSPNDVLTSTNSSYFALTGPGTVFDGNEGTKLMAIRDGTSNTLLFAEAKRAIPWTKPEDVPYDHAQPVPALGGWRPDEFIVVLCDGSAQPVANHEGVDKNLLKPWIEKSDGQIPPRLFPAAPAP